MKLRALPFTAAWTAIIACSPVLAGAEIRLPAILGDHMVLQAGVPKVSIWGWAERGEEITVGFAGRKASGKAGEDGRFVATFPGSLEAGLRGELAIEGSSGARRVLKDVVSGQVWVCSGQSNMEWPVKLSGDPEATIAAADHPDLRLFTVEKAVAGEPQPDVKGSWAACAPGTVPGFSAVAYHFGREVLKGTGQPVGLINTSWGGTPAESWTSREVLAAGEDLKPLLVRWDRAIEEKPEAKGSPHRPAGLYNAMIAPLTPLGIAGFIWYQGESNAGRAEQYRTLFPEMIRDWRARWGREELPFYFVQLANFMAEKPEPGESAWAELRDAQLHALRSVPRTGMAVIIDIGEAKDIHPRNKIEVGKRLARWALKQSYGKDLVESGPLYRAQRKDGDRMVIEFDHLGGGLVAGAEPPLGAPPLKGFAIAGADRQWVWADARIEEDRVVVSSPRVKDPAAVRYAWADNPVANLYNREGLPASPFRTDDWPLTTAGKR